jgi:hypothetical protein
VIGPSQPGFTFSQTGINSNAPARSGVYALYRKDAWVYIGETKNIQNRLTEHLNGVGDNTDILGYGPTGFCFEEWPEHQRVARQDQLIAQLRPLANKT